MRYFSWIDRILQRAGRKGSWVFTSLVILATTYAFFALSSPSPFISLLRWRYFLRRNKEPCGKPKKGPLKESKRPPSQSDAVDSWTQLELYSFLAKHDVYLPYGKYPEYAAQMARNIIGGEQSTTVS